MITCSLSWFSFCFHSLALPFHVVDALRTATKVVSNQDDVQKNGQNLLSAIESHVSGVTHVKLSSFRLDRISCTVGSLGCDGRIKVHASYVDRALRSLSEHTVHATLLQSDNQLAGGQREKSAKRRRVRDENDNANEEQTTNADVDDENDEDGEDEGGEDDNETGQA